MTHRLTPLCALGLVALALALGGCGGSKPSGGSEVTLRDVEVVDGTANDAMVDLDNAATEDFVADNAANSAAPAPKAEKALSTPKPSVADNAAAPE